MAGQLSKIKRQLRSVKSTKKITNAMALVSTAKLQKQKNSMFANNEFADNYFQFLLAAIAARSDEDEETNAFLQSREYIDNPLHIVITSNSGLCGSYNMDLLKYVEQNVPKTEAIFAIGAYGYKWLMNNDYLVVKGITELDDLRPQLINTLIDNVLKLYTAGEISSIDIIYTQYVNSLTFVPSTFNLLPIERPDDLETTDMILEPSRDEVINNLVPKFVASTIYATFLQAKTSEQAARRAAMDAANTNADNLIDELQLSFNQARQASITQEMTEIIAGMGG